MKLWDRLKAKTKEKELVFAGLKRNEWHIVQFILKDCAKDLFAKGFTESAKQIFDIKMELEDQTNDRIV